MSETKQPFAIDLSQLKARPKDSSPQTVATLDRKAAALGFEDRSPKGRRGRKPSPRTGQVHAHIFPDYRDAIAEEAARRGVTQGVLIEEAWNLYCAEHGLPVPGQGRG